jgi:hypothetical protein
MHSVGDTELLPVGPLGTQLHVTLPKTGFPRFDKISDEAIETKALN